MEQHKPQHIIFFIFVSFLLLSLSPAFSKIEDPNFPTPPSFEKRVDFWKKIYTEVDGEEGLIHDTEDFFVYGKIKILHESAHKKNKLITKAAKDKISSLLLSISEKSKEKMTDEEKELFERLGKPTPEKLKERANQVRFQKGQRDKFYSGLIRSQLYLEYIKNEFRLAKVPERLAYLPHVESSFNYQAYSKVGAAGIWQFMRSTGKLYMRINYKIDERRDPIASTRAAIKLLKSNYDRLGAWPLAVTAYNHGPESIARAVEKLQTRDIETIIDDYDGKTFKFASKNFYACFLAASEIAMNADKYFKDIPNPKPLRFTEIPLKQNFTIKEILSITKLSEKTFKDYNLALRPVTYKKNSSLPLGFIVKIPLEDRPAITALEEQVVKKSRPTLTDIATLGTPVPTPEATVAVVVSQATPTPSPVPSVTPTPLATKVAVATSEEKEEEIKIKTKYNFSLKKKKANLYEVVVQNSESLTLFSDWLDTPIVKLALLNKLKVSSDLELNQKITLPISKNRIREFKEKRTEYHLSIEEDFFDNYKITALKTYKVKKGDTLSEIASHFEIPAWLIIQAQSKPLKNIIPKQSIVLPIVEARREEEAPTIPGSQIDETEDELTPDFNPL